jgi:acyl-CoA thioester hydrolase
MPLTHVSPFKVRFYECDAFGHVNNTNYVRYMQEAAFEASAAAGYDFARYDAIGQYWLVRETDVEYLQPLRYGDAFEIKTWVIDFRRVRSRRAYEFRKIGSNDLVARGETDWVYIDNATGRPTTIPPEMIAAFFPEGAPHTAAPRDPFPTAPAPPADVFKLRRRVAWHDIDNAQHVNNAVYLEYVEDCGMRILDAYDWPLSRMLAEGFVILVRRHRVEYRLPAVLNDEIEVATWVSGVKRATATRHYIITRVSDGAVLAQVHSLCVWVNPATGQPIHIPEKFIADYAPNIVE